MSAIEMQSLLARLYVDEYCRLLFRHRPELVLEGYTLTGAEEKALLGIDADRLELHAQTLVIKRKGFLRPHFRFLFALNDLTEDRPVERLLKRFHGLHPATTEVGKEVEVRLFAAFIAQSLQGSAHAPVYTADIARYDLARYETGRLQDRRAVSPNGHAYAFGASEAITMDDVFSVSRGVRVVQLDYNVIDIAAQLQQGRLPTNVGKKRTTVVLQNRDKRLKTFAVSGPTALLLHTIDGHRTVRACVDAVEASFGATGLSGSIVEVLQRLEEASVLARIPAKEGRTLMKRRAS